MSPALNESVTSLPQVGDAEKYGFDSHLPMLVVYLVNQNQNN